MAGHEARPVISPQISSLKCTSREQRMNPTGRDVRKKIDERSAGRVCRFLPREKGMTTAKRTEEPRGSHPFQDSLAVGGAHSRSELPGSPQPNPGRLTNR